MFQECLILMTSISIVKIDPSTTRLESKSHDTSHFFSVSFFVFKQKGVLAKHRWVYSTPHTLLNALIMSNSYNILEMYDEITENLRISFSVFLLSSVVNQLSQIITELHAHKIAHSNRDDAMLHGASQWSGHDTHFWRDGSGKRDGKIGERLRELLAQQIADSVTLLCIFFTQEKEQARPPIVVDGHLCIEPENLAPRTK